MKKNIFVNEEVPSSSNIKFTKSKFNIGYDQADKLLDCFSTYDYPITTHCGQMHADEVYSTALAFIIKDAWADEIIKNDKWCSKKVTPEDIFKIVKRVPETTEELYDHSLVLDLLNGHFDHHMNDDADKHHVNGHPVATFGAMWDSVGDMFNIDLDDDSIIDFNVKEKVYKDFIEKIDLADLYGPKEIDSPYSKLISNICSYTEYDFDFVNIDEVSFETPEEKSTVRFVEAVCMAYKILRAEIVRAQNFIRSFRNISEENGVQIKVNDHGVSFVLINEAEEGKKEPIIPLECLEYVIINGEPVDLLVNLNPSIRDGSYRAIAADSKRMKFDKRIGETGVKGLKFFHPQCFMTTFETKDDLKDFINGLELIDKNTIGPKSLI